MQLWHLVKFLFHPNFDVLANSSLVVASEEITFTVVP